MKDFTSRAFTLVELLTVVVIIAIIAAILFPVFARAKDAAKKTQCVSNEKQLGLALMMYASDDDDVYPGNDPSEVDFSPGFGLPRGYADSMAPRNWAVSIYPYTKSTLIYRCPSQVGNPHPDWSAIPGVAENGYLSNGIVSNRSTSQPPSPADTISMQEEELYLRTAEERPNRVWDSATGASTNVGERFDSSQWSKIHNLGGNLLFCDGHVHYRIKSSISYAFFGAAPDLMCSNGKSGSQNFMMRGDADNTNDAVDNLQTITCPTSL